MIKKILNTKEAIEYLGLGRRQFEAAVRQGDISFKTIGSKRFYPVWVLEKWLNNTINHIDYSSAVQHTTPTSRASSKGDGYALERLAAQMMKPKQPNTVSKDYRKYNNKLRTKPLVDCLA